MAQILVEYEIGVHDAFPDGYLAPVKTLWKDEGVQQVIRKGNEFALHDNLE